MGTRVTETYETEIHETETLFSFPKQLNVEMNTPFQTQKSTTILNILANYLHCSFISYS